MAITVTTDTIVKIIVRSGTNNDRVKTLLSQGELGYATDTKRLFVGDGLTAGGNSVGIRNFGNYGSSYTTIQSPIAQPGDLISNGTSLFYYSSGVGWLPTATNIINDGTTIINNNGTIGLNPAFLSGGANYAYTLSGAATTIQTNSASWNAANNLCMPSNSVFTNTYPNSATYGMGLQVNQPGQFVGYTTGPLGAICICGTNGINTIPYNSTTFNIDGTTLQTNIQTLSTNIATVSGTLNNLENQFNTNINNLQATTNLLNSKLSIVNQTVTSGLCALTVTDQALLADYNLTLQLANQFYVESSFVYAVDTFNGLAGFSNMWQNVFANHGCVPLRLAVANGSSVARTVRIEARVNYHINNHADQVYTRLATFPTLVPTLADHTTWGGVNGSFPLLKPPYATYSPSTVPTNVIDVVAAGGGVNGEFSIPVYISKYYTIPANTTLFFGVQHFISSSSKDKNGSFVEINGWSSGKFNDGITGPRNLVGFTGSSNRNNYPTALPPYKGWYAWGQPPIVVNNVPQFNGAPGSTTLYPQTEHGVSNDSVTTVFNDQNDIVNNNNIFQSRFWGIKNISYISAVFVS